MLTLEKSKKNNAIHVKMRQPMHIFDRFFMIALSAAIALHLIAALLFHIKLFSVGEIETILPATKTYAHFVKGSIQESDAFVIARVNKEGRLTPAKLAPQGTKPSIPTLSPVIQVPQAELIAQNEEEHLFVEIEKDLEENYFATVELPVIAPLIKLEVSGMLAESPLQEFDKDDARFFELHQFSPHNLHQDKIVYLVKVDTRSGQIFWFEPYEPLINNKMHIAIAEKIMKKMLFQTKTDDFIQSGEIEMTFTTGSEDLAQRFLKLATKK